MKLKEAKDEIMENPEFRKEYEKFDLRWEISLFWHKHFSWFNPSKWEYCLEKPVTWKKFWCRSKCHPNGEVFYNPGGDEPDHHCVDCGDEL